MSLKINWDFLGIATSLACAIHCAVLPVVLSSLPLFGINIIHNGVFEWSMICIAFVVGLYSLIHGYRKHHENLAPVVLFTAGFIFLILKQFLPSVEFLLLSFAVLLIITAHSINYVYSRRSKTAKDSISARSYNAFRTAN